MSPLFFYQALLLSFDNKWCNQPLEFPFQIQDTIEKRSGVFKYGARNQAHIEVDGRIITGQNYLSSVLVAEKIIDLLSVKSE